MILWPVTSGMRGFPPCFYSRRLVIRSDDLSPNVVRSACMRILYNSLRLRYGSLTGLSTVVREPGPPHVRGGCVKCAVPPFRFGSRILSEGSSKRLLSESSDVDLSHLALEARTPRSWYQHFPWPLLLRPQPTRGGNKNILTEVISRNWLVPR